MNILAKSIVHFGFYTLVLGGLYPAVVTGIAQVVFSEKANGSLIIQNGQSIGSRLIGQSFTEEGYFWGRPSATFPTPYNAQSSTGSNLSASNPALKAAIEERAKFYGKEVPVDLVTSSGSGLDPEISIAAAKAQVSRIALARGISEQALHLMINKYSEFKLFGLFGAPRVNVLRLNMELDNQ